MKFQAKFCATTTYVNVHTRMPTVGRHLCARQRVLDNALLGSTERSAFPPTLRPSPVHACLPKSSARKGRCGSHLARPSRCGKMRPDFGVGEGKSFLMRCVGTSTSEEVVWRHFRKLFAADDADSNKPPTVRSPLSADQA